MTAADPYVDTVTYSLYIPGDSGAAEVLEAALLASSRQLDRACGRSFGQDGTDDEPVSRVYRTRALAGPLPYGWAESENPYRYGGWTRLLQVDDLVSVAGITIDTDGDGLFTDEAGLATTDYELWPLNAASGAEPEPYQAIYLPTHSTVGGFPPGALIQVTGIFGWPAIPTTIVEMTCRLTALRRNALAPEQAGVRSMSVAGGPSITYADTLGRGAELPRSFLADLTPYRRAASVL